MNLEKVAQFLSGETGIFYLAGAFLTFVVFERLYYAVKLPARYDDRDAGCNLALNFLNSALKIALNIIIPFVAYVFVYENFRLTTISNIALAAGLAFLVNELAYYWEHRLSHRVGLLWAFHSVHHSSNHFNHTVAARGFLFDGLPRVVFALPAALMGVPPFVYIAVHMIKDLFGIWNHADYVGSLGGLDRVFATPANHRVHHANQPQYVDKNYGQVLIVWDRVFGTFEPEGERPVFGLVSRVHDNNPLTVQFAGIILLWNKMRSAPKWQDKLKYLVKPPEWSHDGRCVSECPKYGSLQLKSVQTAR